MSILGQLPHDPAIVEAMVRGQTLTEYSSNGTVKLIREIWTAIEALIARPQNHEPKNVMGTNSPVENNLERSNPA